MQRLEELEGREDPWGKNFVKESPRRGGRWCLSQEAAPEVQGPDSGRSSPAAAAAAAESLQSCPTLGDPVDCSPPGSSLHGIFQARVLEGGAIVFSEKQPW